MQQAVLNEYSQADTAFMQMAALSHWQQHRDALLAAPYAPIERIRAQQLTQLRTLVDYAFANVEFYRNLYGASGYTSGALQSWNDFAFLPIVSKKEIIEQKFGATLVDGADRITGFNTRSSGSSGVPMTTWLDQSDVIRDFAEQTRFLRGDERRADAARLDLYASPWRLLVLVGSRQIPSLSLDGPRTGRRTGRSLEKTQAACSDDVALLSTDVGLHRIAPPLRH